MAKNNNFDAFIQNQTAKSTQNNEKTAYNVLCKYMSATNNVSNIIRKKPLDLNELLCEFFMNVKKMDGEHYEPDSLSTIHRSLQRHLIKNKYKYNILVDKQFKRSRKFIVSRRKQLKKWD